MFSRIRRRNTIRVSASSALYTDQERDITHGDSLDKYPKERDRLAGALCEVQGRCMVFTGHEHLYQRKTVDGITHVITGGGGAPMYGKDEKAGSITSFW